MTASFTQQWAQRLTTAMLIREESTNIALIRAGTYARTSSGGQKRTGATITLPPKLRFFSAVDIDARREFSMEGEIVVADHVLVGMPEDDIRTRDEFLLGTRRFQVVFVHPNKIYECRAHVRELTNG